MAAAKSPRWPLSLTRKACPDDNSPVSRLPYGAAFFAAFFDIPPEL
jgi:hypothetical protein